MQYTQIISVRVELRQSNSNMTYAYDRRNISSKKARISAHDRASAFAS
jgi:hypothetical protein